MRFIFNNSIAILALCLAFTCFSSAREIKSLLPETPGGHIVNGTEVKPHSYPWQVHLLTTITRLGIKLQTVCGGVLIGNNWVLTAAHCVDNIDNVQLTFGAHDWQKDEPNQVRVDSTVAIQHENYNKWSSLEYDIAVVPIDPPITESDTIKIIPLAINEPNPGDMCIATGWGLTAEDGSVSDVLMEVDVLIADRKHCYEKMEDIVPKPNLDGYICLDTTSYKTPCQGDSGGPLHFSEVDTLTGEEVLKVAGVTSFGAKPECEQGGAVAYTSAVYFNEWIFEKTKIAPH